MTAFWMTLRIGWVICHRRKLCKFLRWCLSLPEHEVRDALAPSSLLTRAGLVSLSRVGIFSLRNKLDLLSDKFADIIQSSATDPVTLLRDTVVPSKKPQLTLDNFPHITEPLKYFNSVSRAIYNLPKKWR
jgi:transitional endoplasmic reticulum ATPase